MLKRAIFKVEVFLVKRNALIIGNREYSYYSELNSCVNDVDAMRSDFETLSFENVVPRKNLSIVDMRRAFDDFSADYECDSLNVIYFSGHGHNVKGKDCIIAIDANDSNVETHSIKICDIIEKYSSVHSYLVLIIDACRNFDRNSKNNSKNFSGISIHKDVLIAYSTQIGEVAFCGEGKNLSPFTKAIHSNILKTNLTINSLFQTVREQLNNDKYVQMSCEISTMTRDIPLTYEYVNKSDEDIYNFIMNHSSYSSHDSAFLKACIKATEVFDKGYLDIMCSWQKVENKQRSEWKSGPIYFPEEEYKSNEFKRLTEMSAIKCVEHRFYYKDDEIRIGEIPSLPKSLSEKMPKNGSELKVSLEVSAERKNTKIKIIIDSNLPIGFTLLVSFPNGKSTHNHHTPITGKNTIIEMDEINVGLKDDSFVINISSCSILANDPLIPIVGEQGRNLTGNIKFSSIWGKQVKFEKTLVLNPDVCHP